MNIKHLLFLLVGAFANLLDWRLQIGGVDEFYCSPDYCHVPLNWTVEYPVLIIEHQLPLHIDLISNQSVGNTLCAKVISQHCDLSAAINNQTLTFPTDQDWQIVCWPLESASQVTLTLNTSNCTLALADLFFQTTDTDLTNGWQEPTADLSASYEENDLIWVFITIGLLAMGLSIASGFLLYRRCRFQQIEAVTMS